MNELQILYRDTTKSSTDRNQYDTEFTKLRTQYRDAVRNSTYNGISLLQGSLSVTVNEGLATYDLANLSGDVRDSVAGGWAITDGGTYATITGTAGLVTNLGANNGDLVLSVGGRANQTITIAANATMSSIVSTINSAGAGVTASLTGDGFLKLVGNNQGESVAIKNATTANLATALGLTRSDTAVSASGATDNTLAEIQNLATARAKNGADQSALQYYSELATATKTNFESAVGRIMDVDVAQESTQLARWSTLVQAGTAMMAQANGSTVSALSLLKG
jgi:flagellin-like hook-associated protein FlgL